MYYSIQNRVVLNIGVNTIWNETIACLLRGIQFTKHLPSKSFFSKERLNLSTRTQLLIYLSILAILDAVIPIPITAMFLIMILFQKPKWFKDWVDEIYRLWCTLPFHDEWQPRILLTAQLTDHHNTSRWASLRAPLFDLPSALLKYRCIIYFGTCCCEIVKTFNYIYLLYIILIPFYATLW